MEPDALRTFHPDGTIACAVRIVTVLPAPEGLAVVLPDETWVRLVCLALVVRHGSDLSADGLTATPFNHQVVAGIGEDGRPLELGRFTWI